MAIRNEFSLLHMDTSLFVLSSSMSSSLLGFSPGGGLSEPGATSGNLNTPPDLDFENSLHDPSQSLSSLSFLSLGSTLQTIRPTRLRRIEHTRGDEQVVKESEDEFIDKGKAQHVTVFGNSSGMLFFPDKDNE